MANSKFRVGGAYTAFTYNNKLLQFVDVVRETAPRPVAAPQAIQPLDHGYPIEIALPNAIEAGTIEVTFREQWNTEVWEQLPGFEGADDLLQIFQRQITNQAQPIQLGKMIGGKNGLPTRTIVYSGLKIVNVMIDETVNIGTMTFPKSIQFMYLKRKEHRPVSQKTN